MEISRKESQNAWENVGIHTFLLPDFFFTVTLMGFHNFLLHVTELVVTDKDHGVAIIHKSKPVTSAVNEITGDSAQAKS